MGELWLARSQGAAGWEKQVVLKTILPHLSDQPEFVERFLDEANIATTLSHGNIVPVFELGHDQGTYFIAMEYVDGWDLRTLLRRVAAKHDPFPEGIALYVAAEVCRGLDYAHNRRDEHDRPRQIVHRDISPANLLLSRNGEVRIVDFGIASARWRLNTTQTGELRGKFAYMSPEQAAGQAVDARSDLFSLGVVLYEMLAGTRPFEGDSDLEVLGRVQRAEYRSLRELRPDLDEATYRLVEKALALKIDDRFVDAAAMQVAILNILYQETGPVAARQLADFCLRYDRPRYSTGDISKQSFDDLLSQQLLEANGQPDEPTPSFITPSGFREHDPHLPRIVPVLGEGLLQNNGSKNGFELGQHPNDAHDKTRTITFRSRSEVRRRRILISIGIVLFLIALVSILAFRLGSRSASNAPVVRVSTQPDGALIYFNGVSYGRSTLVARPAAGEWLIRAELDGYAPVEEPILYDGRTDLDVRLTLAAIAHAAATQSVTIQSIPPGSRFRIDGGSWRAHGESVAVPIDTPITIEFERKDDAPLRFEHSFGAGESIFVRQVTTSDDGGPNNTSVPEDIPVAPATPPRETSAARIRVTGLPSGARVFVNGEQQANTAQLRLPHDRTSTIRAEASGYQSKDVRFDPRTGARELNLRLDALAQGTVTVRFIGSVLIGEVLVDGRSHGVNSRAPRTQIRLPAGKHTILVRNQELQLQHEETVEVRENEDTMLRIDW